MAVNREGRMGITELASDIPSCAVQSNAHAIYKTKQHIYGWQGWVRLSTPPLPCIIANENQRTKSGIHCSKFLQPEPCYPIEFCSLIGSQCWYCCDQKLQEVLYENEAIKPSHLSLLFHFRVLLSMHTEDQNTV